MKTIFQRYGDYGDREAAGSAPDASQNTAAKEWPLWEVFIRSKAGLDHKHAGSLHAADAQMAVENARDVYTRRMEGVSIWVVESKYIHASAAADSESLYDPSADKVYRHPTFYTIPDEIGHM
ncbi:MAG: 1,2-phenylacetyl-CoA epoxidase subunit B [Sphingobacteriales bacterium]|nr:MAG: 1,2-phenylacetyl-CoA epoxidase subunit B [Sphingobacteriales bacterium]